MIPVGSGRTVTIKEEHELPSDTYKLSTGNHFVGGSCAGLEAIKQAAFKILSTERYHHIIYSWDYGVELADLFGKPTSFVCPEIERRVTEALLQDSRIQSVSDFKFQVARGVVHCTFAVHTTMGAFSMGKEVSV